MRGVEPPRPFEHKNLNLARLPIPPHPHFVVSKNPVDLNHQAQLIDFINISKVHKTR